jgi:hypothetical protein
MLRYTLIILVLSIADLTLAQELNVDVVAVKNLVIKWNDAHTLNNLPTLLTLYSDEVSFYGTTTTPSRCISIKRAALEKADDFTQSIKTGMNLSAYSSGSIRCDFIKTVTRNNKTVDYKAYLVIKQIDGEYLIVGESDLVTDRKLKIEPDLGTKVAINKAKHEATSAASIKKDAEDDAAASSYTGTIAFAGSVALGIVGMFIAFREWKKRSVPKQPGEVVNAPAPSDYDKGYDFEKYIVDQFALKKDFFTLMEWRSDKIHNGTFPQSNRNPDMEYEFSFKDFTTRFAVECKYRSKTFDGSVHIMDENKFRTYEVFHNSEMPVYIALGLAGEPNKPNEVYLIPFDHVKL